MAVTEDAIPAEAVRLAMASRARDLIDLPDPMVLSDERLTRRMLAAAAPQMIPAELRAALNSLGSCVAFHSRDWAQHPRDAWLYGVITGWDCEDGRDDPDHVHDDLCGGDGPMREMAARHGWSDDEIARLRGYRDAVAAALGLPPVPALATKGGE